MILQILARYQTSCPWCLTSLVHSLKDHDKTYTSKASSHDKQKVSTRSPLRPIACIAYSFSPIEFLKI